MNVKQVIVIRKDLNMRKGKLAAQAAHASMKVILDRMRKIPFSVVSNSHSEGRFVEYTLSTSINTPLHKWLSGSFTKVVVSVDSLEELMVLKEKADELKIINAIIEDNGYTEFHGEKTITCLAIGPYYSDKIDSITGHLKLL